MTKQKWKGYEKRIAKQRRRKHIGGPGKPNYSGQGEVKAWNKKLSKSKVMEEARKGRKEIVSKKGFTEEAIKYRDRYRRKLKLYHSNKLIKLKRKK